MPVAVITGASRGLGAGLAEAFAGAGLRLGLCARSESPVPPGAEAVSRNVDVTDAATVDAFAAEVVEILGPIDLWVNNAGLLGPIAPLRDADPDELGRHLAVNVLGVAHGAATYIRHRRAAGGGGVLVNISSGAAESGVSGWAAYCSGKAAVDRLTEVITIEEADTGLRAYAVAPGVVDTDMQALIRSTPPERFPAVGRFHDLKQRDAFNTPAWVGQHLLDLALGDLRPDSWRWRVPDQPH